MGGGSFHRPASRSFRVAHAKGYAAFFRLPIHNFWLYLARAIIRISDLSEPDSLSR